VFRTPSPRRPPAALAAVGFQRLALGGFSDGASDALSLGIGIGNGDLFRARLAFSPDTLAPEAQVGMPRIVPLLRQHGYDVTCREFVGGHTVTVELAREAFQGWFMGGAPGVTAGGDRRR
jgi:phospholipase/carboxylesterase